MTKHLLRPGPKPKPISEKEKKMASLINAGHGIKEAMTLSGIKGYPNVHKDRLVKAGLISEKVKRAAISRVTILNHWLEGLSESEIARVLDVSRQYVWRIVRESKDCNEIKEMDNGERVLIKKQ